MAVRTRRARWLAIFVCIAIVFLLYERSAIQTVSYPDSLNVGGGSVLRSGEVAEKYPDPRPPPPASPAQEPMIKDSNPLKPVEPESKAYVPEVPAPKVNNPTLPEPSPLQAQPVLPSTPEPDEKPIAVPSTSPTLDDAHVVHGQPEPIDQLYESVPTASTTTAPPVYWTKQPEQYPVTSTIKLPTGSPKPIPRIQYEGRGGAAEPERLAAVKEAAKHAWNGYREYGWGYDEVRPVKAKGKNSFNGWGATLVDSLDTLWVMGLKDEFEDAVNQTSHIDFTTSPRKDIPLFEVTIRYLGGLIAAYDVSGGKYKVLLDQAVQLGEILYSAFDTPNRMPETYYQWRPTASGVPRMSSGRQRVVLAELGTLSLEFTRLAQLSGEPKYYDAIARITDAFDDWQNRTRLPGMWPTSVDASGCGWREGEAPSQTQPKYIPAPGGESYMITSQPVRAGEGLTDTMQLSKGPEKIKGEKAAGATVDMPSKAGDLTVEAPKKAGNTKVDSSKKPSTADKAPGYIKAAPAEPDAAALAQAEKTLMNSMNHDAHMDAAMEAMDKNVANPMAHTGKSSDMRHPSEHAPNEPSYDKLRERADRKKRQLDEDNDAVFSSIVSSLASQPSQSAMGEEEAEPECIPQGLESPSKMAMETFTLGGQSDSVYEYFPKEWLLLGGLVPQYKDMYLKSAETVINNLLFRPMTPDNADILISGELKAFVNYTTRLPYNELIAKNEHLTCFAGGMFAMGGKLFDKPEHIEIGRRLTDGCVWSYNATASGIMPEGAGMIACEDAKHCEWNETKWWEELDPYRSYREESRVQFFIDHPDYDENAVAETDAPSQPAPAPKAKTVPAHPKPESLAYTDQDAPPLDASPLPEPKTVPAHSQPDSLTAGSDAAPLDAPQVLDTADERESSRQLRRRQLDDELDISTKQTSTIPESAPATAAAADPAKTPSSAASPLSDAAVSPLSTPLYGDSTVPDIDVSSFPTYIPKPPMTHQQYISMKLKDDRLPPGFINLDRKYILRPEAIESVFYMYRITGEQYWRDVGWKMFQAVEKATRVEHGHSAVVDVTVAATEHRDEMESFWLAETLKYYWLLFEDREKWSLDEWVLNTEAHFFRRPDAGVWKG